MYCMETDLTEERNDRSLQKRRRRYDIGLPDTHSTHAPKDTNNTFTALRNYNLLVHNAWVMYLENKPLPAICIPDAIVDMWILGTNIAEIYSKDILLNRSQLLGLIIARYRAVYQTEYRSSKKSLLDYLVTSDNSSILQLFEKPVSEYNLKELRYDSL